jgi:L-malate glycosyltransferase
VEEPSQLAADAAEPIRVLWLIKGLGPGGAERLLVSMAKVADHARFRYEAAYLLRSRNRLAADLESLGVPAVCLDSEGHGGRRWPFRLRRLVLARRYDVVHIHSPFVAGIARLVLHTLPRQWRPAIVYTEHNSWASYQAGTRLLNATTYRLDDAHVAVSDQVVESVWPHLRKDLPMLLHGIALDDLCTAPSDRAETRAELGLGPEHVVMLAAANFRAHKAYPDLLEAARSVCTNEPRARFLIAGQGPLEADMRSHLAAMGVGDRVRILGYRDDVFRLMAAADIFVMSSLYEGLPIAVMEALCSGLPVVATNVGGMPAAVVHGVNGFLVPPRQPEQLADRIRQVVADDRLRAQLAIAAESSRDRYDIRRATQTLEVLYARLASQRRTKAERSSKRRRHT